MVFQSIRQRLPPLPRRSPVQIKNFVLKDSNRDGKSTFPMESQTDARNRSEESPVVTNAPADIVIAGGGIVGLVLALALHHHGVCRHVQIYEQASAFHDDVGESRAWRYMKDILPLHRFWNQAHSSLVPFDLPLHSLDRSRHGALSKRFACHSRLITSAPETPPGSRQSLSIPTLDGE